MSRRGLWLLFGVFLATRLALIYVGADPRVYQGRDHDIAGDVWIYADWADGILERREVPYREVRIEYPPGSLPFVVAPALGKVLTGVPYHAWFATGMLAVDLLGLVALLRMARREGSTIGPWVWVGGLALLGPVVWVRLDLVPAVALLWAMERITSGAWNVGAGLLAFGAGAKVFPGLLFLPSAAAAPSRVRFIGVGAMTSGALLAPFIVILPDLVSSVAGYHLQRGIQLESLWGGVLLLAGLAGHPVEVAKRFGAWEALSPWASILGAVSLVLVAAILGASILVARGRRGDVRFLAGLWFATLTMLLAVGPVLSPQFVVWLVAAGGGAVAVRSEDFRAAALLLLPLTLLTHLVYPISYDGLVVGEPASVWLLVLRNGLLVAIAGVAMARVLAGRAWRRRTDEPPAAVPPALRTEPEGRGQ